MRKGSGGRRGLGGLMVLLAVLVTTTAEADLASALRAWERGDHRLAFWEWLLLAGRGDASAEFNIGTAYFNGQAVERDYAQAAEWYDRAARQGHVGAQHVLGLMYEAGRGVAQDGAAAAAWFRQAAAQGYPPAQHNLGVLYTRGDGVPQDPAEAARWFLRAAEQGYASSQVRVGVMLDVGEARPPDLVQAYKWYVLAADRLKGPERRELEVLIDALRQRMSRAQLDAAQRLAETWRPDPEGADRAAPVWPRALSGGAAPSGGAGGGSGDRAGGERPPLDLRELCASYGPACGPGSGA